jgi:SagB-type dehydrogenase family enzyme
MSMIQSAKDYHQKTSYDRARMSGHFLDWPNQPNVFKTYTGLSTVPLSEPPQGTLRILSELLQGDPADATESRVDQAVLSRLLHLTHAVTAKTRHGGVDFYFRSVASAGALYPCELYVAVMNAEGLQDGLYHHTIGLTALTLLRKGSVLGELSDAVRIQRDTPPCLIFFLTSLFFRSSWKYRDRAYRYHLLDTGHMLENLGLALREAQLPFLVHYDFDDQSVNDLLGLDGSREVCFAVIPAWAAHVSSGEEALPLEAPRHDLAEESRCARRDTDYPEIREIHAASCRVVEVKEPFPDMLARLGPQLGPAQPIPEAHESAEFMSYPEAVFKRRSMRNFAEQEINAESFGALLRMLCSTAMVNAHAEPGPSHAVAVGFLANKVPGFEPGFYLLNTVNQTVHLVFPGLMGSHMAHVCLDQVWLENCAVHFLFLTNLGLLDRTYGPRGYRYAVLTAGRLGQRLYLGTTAMRLGCCGIGAFYDREAAGTLALNDESALLYVVAAGPTRRWYTR